ncbi:hypothetical protein HanXRQr2_Chr12g0544891 [Helianthus annuus]|uniref:Uncharacterized protein n=1 Tax=Helianthus annuus TaxID=4232 RepID=A0A9K3HH24_HELAN|nr:hypothetical protein HanXRQr2_Chr12g0544891 [Helianthus annuus]KAJ0489641.1 hypothetical protein HanHA300_Chr12g0446381 [Helianthus annuus]KAJ0505553.1 hypothetical protein HanHA89_Chr12g0471861 [Helianthus annuus]KAJ0675222.1 hypothetical protein HanLR1_Chr12g0448801 [Helianthus annuus]KAJ0862975.1 hypothetical protein HanPSC8_Chr12g0524531 [Helianthus annuus]
MDRLIFCREIGVPRKAGVRKFYSSYIQFGYVLRNSSRSQFLPTCRCRSLPPPNTCYPAAYSTVVNTLLQIQPRRQMESKAATELFPSFPESHQITTSSRTSLNHHPLAVFTT